MSTFDDKEEPREEAYQPIDFKELSIYKILSDLGLGPQVRLLFNPYLKDGVYLVTEDIRESGQQFTEIGKLPSALDTHLRSTLLKLQEVNKGLRVMVHSSQYVGIRYGESHLPIMRFK